MSLVRGEMPAGTLIWIGTAVVLVMLGELVEAWKKGSLREEGPHPLMQTAKAAGIALLSVAVVLGKFLFVGTILAKSFPVLGLPESKEALVWYGSVSIGITVLLSPLIRRAVYGEEAAQRIGCALLYALLTAAGTACLSAVFHAPVQLPLHGHAVIGLLMTLAMYFLLLLEREMKQEDGEQEELGKEQERSGRGSGISIHKSSV
ncbi:MULTISPECIES: hypothetical protein [unclassified Paenibacillus]|uniref:hypothetical protein n=1 Tax=unclassified Paenibacillus TaxID=185978 RepID=UPI00030187AF|nr:MULTISPECIES: hypothetical protein [unclassified Paenibacillus]EPD86031.1 hypothetical protein HMPREF1207_02986 [Paenibacillus sp. HGH0039]